MPLDRVWTWYLLTAAAAAVLYGRGAPQGQPWLYAALHLALLVAVHGLARAVAGRPAALRSGARAAFTLLAIPLVFLSMAMVLPALNPEPWEWSWIELDRALCGGDPTVALQAVLQPWVAEVLQWVYASFYLIPVATVAVLGWRCGRAAFDRGLVVVTFCFLLSYLGYFLWPTLPPYHFLAHDVPIEGAWLGGTLRRGLDAAELHRWNCFPSGHTMLSVVCLVLAWRVRPLFWLLLPVVSALVFSTMALRYHFLSDVLAGVALVVPGMAVGLWLAGPTAPAAADRCATPEPARRAPRGPAQRPLEGISTGSTWSGPKR